MNTPPYHRISFGGITHNQAPADPGLVATFAKEVEKIRGFLPTLRSSEFGE